MDLDSVPDFTLRESSVGIIVTAATRYHCDIVTAVAQFNSEIGQVLRRRNYIRIEALINQKYLHWE